MKPLVKNPDAIRLAMLGMVDGNGHPYSWSAIINGKYDPSAIAQGGYPQINTYLDVQPRTALGIPGVRVTHVHCNNPADAERVSRAASIPQVVKRPEDVIGEVDAVVIATDIGHEHVARARPFIEAGLPVFIDKPLTDRADHLRQFIEWQRAGHACLSTSCLRYAREYADARKQLTALGDLRLITMSMSKTWERYGIHAMEGVYPFLPAGGWESVTNTGTSKANIVHVRHRCGVDVVLAVIADLYGAFGHLALYGAKGSQQAAFRDTFYAFKTQSEVFVEYLRTGQLPFPFEETVELMKIIIAGIRSREEGGRTVRLTEVG